jgi:alpha-methylacyl-CoA racemase
MLLADMGAEILRIERREASMEIVESSNVLNRSRPSLTLDLKKAEVRDFVLELCEQADVLVEGLRPGVTERLGLGPAEVLERNPSLVYGRMTGFGQEGPMSQRAGHDINYISISGALWAMGRSGERPLPPLNLVGDFGGGSLFLVFGIVSAVLWSRATGEGQVVDAAMVDGSASMMAMTHSLINAGAWKEERGVNTLDSGAHFYEVYETKDHRYIAVGAIEPKFYAELLKGLGLAAADLPQQMDRAQWPAMKIRFTEIVATKSRDEWTEIFSGTDACVTPVLSPREAAHHPYNAARNVFVTDGNVQPQPAPRFSKTPGKIREISKEVQVDLAMWGVTDERWKSLRDAGALA